MKIKNILKVLSICLLLPSCNGGNNNQDPTPTPTPTPVEPTPTPSEPTPTPTPEEEDLTEEKQKAIQELEDFPDYTKYRKAELEEIDRIIAEGTRIINSCKTADDILIILDLYEGYIMEVKTDKEYKKEAYDKCTTTEQIEAYKKLGYEALYQDSNYKRGYIVTKPTYGSGESPYHSEYLRTYSYNNYTPAWTIAQWTSRYDIMGTGDKGGYTHTSDEDGVINTYTSKGKEVNGTFVPGKVITANSKTGELYLECNTSVEYEQHRTGSEGWVHLLYSQDFSNNLVNVKNCSSIMMEAEFTIESCKNMMGSSYNTNIHAAQLCWYITIQNRSGGYSNPDYGKYIWFGIPLWDNRTEGKTASMYRAHDAGTDTLIYNPSSKDIFADGKQPKIGVKAKAKIDIRPLIDEAFAYAKNNGYLGDTKLEDLYIGGTNFGYEVPGTFDIASTIHSINVFYK